MNYSIWWLFFIYVLEGNLQWNSWIFKMIDYLKVSIVQYKLNFEKGLENKCEAVWWWQISSKTIACRKYNSPKMAVSCFATLEAWWLFITLCYIVINKMNQWLWHVFCIIGYKLGENIGHRRIPLTKGQWCGSLIFSAVSSNML